MRQFVRFFTFVVRCGIVHALQCRLVIPPELDFVYTDRRSPLEVALFKEWPIRIKWACLPNV